MDSLPPPPSPPSAILASAPADIRPRNAREQELCSQASHPDWPYLAGLLAIGTAGIAYGSWTPMRDSAQLGVRMISPAVVGLTWGATVGGIWLTLPQCNDTWVAGPPREGQVRTHWQLAVSLAILAGVTAPIVNGIITGTDFPVAWTTLEREMHVVTAGVMGFAGALVPYLVPPRSWAAARELDRLRLGVDARGVFLGYSVQF